MHEKIIVSYIATLAAIEVGLGAFLHSFRIPFSGHSLSLNQIFILTRATIDSGDKSAGRDISTVCALMKTMSPAGKKLTPMLAITAQGHLYSIGVAIFGSNIAGYVFGAILLSLWAFIQPICIYLILFGEDLIYLLNYFVKKLNHIINTDINNIIEVLILLILVKMILAVLVSLIAYKISPERLSLYNKWAISHKKVKKKSRSQNRYLAALQDLVNPMFIFSYSLFIIFFVFVKSELSPSIWFLLRPFAVGYTIFLIMRIIPTSWVSKVLKNSKIGRYLEIYRKEYLDKNDKK